MALYTMKELLDDAQKNAYGVGFYNTINLEMVRACIRAAENEKSPIIIGTAEGLLEYADFDCIVPLIKNEARLARVPVAIHLDHAYNFDLIMRALKAGFGSVMFDGSILDYEENVRISSEIAKVTKPMGVGLECELGKVGGLPEGKGVVGDNIYTDPDQAKDFVLRSGADFLAVSIGTTHGVFKDTPKLDFNRLAEIKNEVPIPLVLHGGSGLSDTDFKTCIKGGICKVNIYTDVITGALNRIKSDKENLSYPDLMRSAENAMYDIVVEKIRLFESNNRA